MILSKEELELLTDKRIASAQKRVLKAIGIPFRERPDGSIVVFKEDCHATKKDRPPSPKLRLPEARSVLAR
ncbi:DUF4224 domain-containing protein [Thauera aromatica]|uniref:DUF4224 domain-containing protein n=1 Tax=Thauera aromatica TaxID=59405 RepID=UPI003D7E90F6